MEFSKTFRDGLGREFTVNITTAAVRRLSELPQPFLLNSIMAAAINEDNKETSVQTYQAFLDDDLRFADVLYAILRSDVDRLGISKEQFEEGLAGEGKQRAALAFMVAFTDFSQGSRKTILRGLQVAMGKATRFHELAIKRIEQEADKLTDEVMQKMLDTSIQNAQHAQNGATLPAASPAASSKPATATAAI